MVPDATCPIHPGVPAVGTCARCGTFMCGQDFVLFGGKTYCRSCAQRPDVDYLEAFRHRYLGKRDGWAWLFGLGGIGNAGLAALMAFTFVNELPNGPKESLPFAAYAAVAAFSAVNGVLFWLGKPIARWGFLVGVVAATALEMAIAGPAGLVVAFIPLVVTANIFFNWRTRLFFRLEVTRGTLQRAWDLLHNNAIARQAALLGMVGLLVPGLGLIALVMGIIGLQRVDPTAYPPIGKKAYAIAGIVLGALSSAGWAAAFSLGAFG